MRPKKGRNIECSVEANYFKPRGIPMSELQEIELQSDEIEAIRLAHIENQYQEVASKKMNISRQTFGRILDNAHKKIANALINGKALKIDI